MAVNFPNPDYLALNDSVYCKSFLIAFPGSVGRACQPSRRAVTLVDVHTLGALLEVLTEGYSDCY